MNMKNHIQNASAWIVAKREQAIKRAVEVAFAALRPQFVSLVQAEIANADDREVATDQILRFTEEVEGIVDDRIDSHLRDQHDDDRFIDEDRAIEIAEDAVREHERDTDHISDADELKGLEDAIAEAINDDPEIGRSLIESAKDDLLNTIMRDAFAELLRDSGLDAGKVSTRLDAIEILIGNIRAVFAGKVDQVAEVRS